MTTASIMEALAILLLVSSWVSFTEQKPSYFITAPKLIRIDVKESITVQVFEAQSNVDASVYLINQKTMDLCSDKYVLHLNQTNYFTQDLLIQIRPEQVEKCKVNRRTSYITLAAEMPELFPKRRMVHLHLRPKPYFVFIETNKPIYRPKETVYFRSFTLDHKLKLTDCKATLEILQANHVVMEVESRSEGSEKICRGEIHISPSMVGDIEIQAASTGYSEYNGHRKFRIMAPGETEGQRNDTAVKSYVVNLTKTRRFFIPGAPFQIQATVTYPDHSLVMEVPIEISILITEKKTIQVSQKGLTDNIGEMSLSFTVPPDASEMYITATAGSKDSGTEGKSEIAVKAHQGNQTYLCIDVPSALLYPGDSIDVTLTALGLTDSSNVDHYYYMILNKGKLLHHERIGRSTNTSFLVNITQDMVPYFRIVAYYLVEINGKKRLVSDSVRLEVEDLCDVKFQILPSLLMDNDQRDLLLSVFTESTADVYVQAVNEQLASAHVDLGMFQQVFYRRDLYDFGTSYGGGRNTAKVFEDAGLRFISDLMQSSELRDNTVVPWQRSPLQPHRDGLRIASTYPIIQPLYRLAWMWEIQETTGSKTFRLTSDVAPPKLWEISAFSVLENSELCIAKPLIIKINDEADHTWVNPDSEFHRTELIL
ncbi:complement C4-B-like [Pristis pectinata]|uniref:complement C4-B-like n=1 Tax=Pristis pectinata TaxID=685728 RepID=UPI00223CEE31|nr:complement C4-B-like [Pristis pectinata]